MPSLPGTHKIRQIIEKYSISLPIVLLVPPILQIVLMGDLIITAEATSISDHNYYISALSIILAIAYPLIVWHYVIKPLNRLTKVAGAIAAGNLRQFVPSHPLAELSSLARAIDALRQNLQDDNQLLQEKVRECSQALTAQKTAEISSKAKSEFIANMSHELRTPLNAILGLSELISQDPSTSDIHRQYLEIMQQGGEDLLNLANDLVDLSKMEAGYISVSVSCFKFSDLMKSIELLLWQGAALKSLELSFEIGEGTPKYIIADRGKLRQVIVNLVANAIKFTERGKVSARSQVIPLNSSTIPYLLDEIPEAKEIKFPPQYNYRLNVMVEDTGLGIEAAEMETLFEPFVQAKAGRMSQQGSGLGLSIVYQLLRLMGGDIFASSTPNKGTIFRFYIPIEVSKIDELLS